MCSAICFIGSEKDEKAGGAKPSRFGTLPRRGRGTLQRKGPVTEFYSRHYKKYREFATVNSTRPQLQLVSRLRRLAPTALGRHENLVFAALLAGRSRAIL